MAAGSPASCRPLLILSTDSLSATVAALPSPAATAMVKSIRNAAAISLRRRVGVAATL